jgi:hypothetical protein
MAKVLSGSGHKKDISPNCSQDLLCDAISAVFSSEDVEFSRYSLLPLEDRYFKLFRDLLMVLPAVIAASGKPVSLLGLGSFRISGKPAKFKVSFSNTLSKILADNTSLRPTSGDVFSRRFLMLFRKLTSQIDASAHKTLSNLTNREF